jgi:hypothetical protein
MSTASATYVAPSHTKKRYARSGCSEFLREPGIVKRTAASEELIEFELEGLIDCLMRLQQDAEEAWFNDPPLLLPKEVRHVHVEYRLGGRLDFPPLSDEDQKALDEMD